jgi:hypothetical protein
VIPAARSLVRALAVPGSDGKRRSVRAIVAAMAQLGHVVSRAAVGRLLGPAKTSRTSRPRPSRAKPPAMVLARAAVRIAGSAEAAEELLRAALAELETAAAT